MKCVGWFVAVAISVLSSSVAGQEPTFGERLEPASIQGVVKRYGSERGQEYTLIRGKGDRPAPLVLMFTGWGFATLADRIAAAGMTVAIVGYRDPGKSGIDGWRADARAALRAIAADPRTRVDLQRIAVIGSNSGAIPAALLATAPNWRTGIVSPIRSVTLFNPFAIDVDGELTRLASRNRDRDWLIKIFGTDAARRSASPLAYAATPGAPPFTILTYDEGAKTGASSASYRAALDRAGSPADYRVIPYFNDNSEATRLGGIRNAETTSLIDRLKRALR